MFTTNILVVADAAKVVTDLGQQVADRSPAWLLGVVAVGSLLGGAWVVARWFKREEDIFRTNQSLGIEVVKATAGYESLSKQVIEGMRRYDEKLDSHGDKLERIERTITRIEVGQTRGGRGGARDAV